LQENGIDDKGSMSAVVEMSTDVIMKDIWYEGNFLFCVFLLGLGTGFLYYSMSTLWDCSLHTFTKRMRG
jgi:hypothetical protein